TNINNSGSLTLNAINGGFNLDLTSTGSSVLNGAINIASLTTATTGTTTVNTTSITTTGAQLFQNAVTFTANATLTAGATSSVGLANGVTGLNLNINANSASLGGTVALNNLTVTGTGVNNTFG